MSIRLRAPDSHGTLLPSYEAHGGKDGSLHFSTARIGLYITAVAFACLMLLGNTKCQSIGTSSSSTGLSAGGGAVAIPNLHIHVRNAAGQTVAAASLIAAAAWAHHTLASTPATIAAAAGDVPVAYGVGDPCYKHSKKTGKATDPYGSGHKIATFSVGRVLGGWPYLDCSGMRKAIRDHGLPARIKSIVQCIAVIMTKGSVTRGPGLVTYRFGDGVVNIDSELARITSATPANGTWSKCARQA